MYLTQEVTSIPHLLLALFAIIFALISVIGAARTGVFRKTNIGQLKLKDYKRNFAETGDIDSADPRENGLPYEIEQLESYYAQVLSQSKISFWFSLIFASLGFAVIIIAVILHEEQSIGATVVSFTAGTIIDAISALFFVQSKSAQKAMGEFFDKLRKDYQQLESRNICASIKNKVAKDALNIQLALHFAQVEDTKNVSEFIISKCLVDEVIEEHPNPSM